MTLLIWGAIIIGLILAPMSLLIPSAQQKIQIELRMAARRLGIGVNILPKEIKPGLTLEGVSYLIPPRHDAKMQALEMCFVGTQLEHTWLPKAWGSWQIALGEMEQLNPEQLAALKDFSQELPASSFALEVSSEGLVFWWQENLAFTPEKLEKLSQEGSKLLLHFER